MIGNFTRQNGSVTRQASLAAGQRTVFRQKFMICSFASASLVGPGEYGFNYGQSAVGSGTYRSQYFAGYLLPEMFINTWDLNPSVLALSARGFQSVAAATNVTGASTGIVRRRYILDVPLAGGVRIGNLSLMCSYAHGNNANRIVIGANTGQAGTAYVTLSFGVIAIDGAKTQIGTATQSFSYGATATSSPIYISVPVSGTTSDGDVMYVELEITLDQTSRTAGTNQSAVQISTGIIKSNTYYHNTRLEMDFS